MCVCMCVCVCVCVFVWREAWLTLIPGVHPLGQQEAAELLLGQAAVLHLHQVRSHPERVVLQVALALLAAAAGGEGCQCVGVIASTAHRATVSEGGHDQPFLQRWRD